MHISFIFDCLKIEYYVKDGHNQMFYDIGLKCNDNARTSLMFFSTTLPCYFICNQYKNIQSYLLYLGYHGATTLVKNVVDYFCKTHLHEHSDK